MKRVDKVTYNVILITIWLQYVKLSERTENEKFPNVVEGMGGWMGGWVQGKVGD